MTRKTRAAAERDNEQLLYSQRNSMSSQAHSTRPLLREMYLDPPNPPFNHDSSRRESGSSSTLQGGTGAQMNYNSPFSSPARSRNPSPAPLESPLSAGLSTADSNVSLSVNYLPNKFSQPRLASGGQRHRRPHGKKRRDLSPGAGLVPKMGGGVDAFRSGEARMGGPEDDDEDERVEDGGGKPRFGKGTPKKTNRKLRWNKFKWTLFFTNLLLMLYSFVALVFCLLTWFNVWARADIVRVGNRTELIVSTVAACIGIFTSVLGWAGILLNNRSFLAVYCLLTWITFTFLLIPGYMTYKRRTFNLEGKVNAQWSKSLGSEGRLRIQNELACCGYFSPFVEATISSTCYARTILPGCKLRYLTFERMVLKRWYSVAFGLVPVQLLVMIAGLLCSNHVTYRFGKGMMPKAYRLSMTSMAIIMDNYATQLAEQYGLDVASEILKRSRSNLHLDIMPTSPYTPTDLDSNGKVPGYYTLNTKPPSADPGLI